MSSWVCVSRWWPRRPLWRRWTTMPGCRVMMHPPGKKLLRVKKRPLELALHQQRFVCISLAFLWVYLFLWPLGFINKLINFNILLWGIYWSLSVLQVSVHLAHSKTFCHILTNSDFLALCDEIKESCTHTYTHTHTHTHDNGMYSYFLFVGGGGGVVEPKTLLLHHRWY